MGRLIFESEFQQGSLPIEWFVKLDSPIDVTSRGTLSLCRILPNDHYPHYLAFRFDGETFQKEGQAILIRLREFIESQTNSIVLRGELDLSYNVDIFQYHNVYQLLFFDNEQDMMLISMSFPELFVPVMMFREDSRGIDEIRTWDGKEIENVPWKKGMSHVKNVYRAPRRY